MSREYVFSQPEADALLRSGFSTADVRVYARDVRIR
jgi:hypothetical protein